jgi:hypothetical protein
MACCVCDKDGLHKRIMLIQFPFCLLWNDDEAQKNIKEKLSYSYRDEHKYFLCIIS